ncbi:MAG: class I SAM-dependent methyltransferase [Desulfosoma sp.]|uniref:class I SAM-dependent methyltransferase n=1 Tax=Desulfosoma sp. TaxID=2603217 RepID=UPI00404A5D3A
MHSWCTAWNEAKAASPLAHSQKETPQRWQAFFEAISDCDHAMWGDQGGLGPRIADLLFSEGIAYPSCRVLDAGSGPGTVSIPLAERGARITALDYSEGMLRALSQRAESQGVKGIESLCTPFFDFKPDEAFDLVLGCFFPAALSPEGLKHMESLSSGHCALVLSSFREQIPFCRALWREIMGYEPPSGDFHLIYAFGFLFAGKKAPNIKHLSWAYTFMSPLEETQAFFSRYFEIFDRKGPSVQSDIARVLKGFVKDGLVTCAADVKIALLWWRAYQH